MRSTTNHIIHKQTIDIRFNDFTTAHRWDAANQAKTAEAVRMSIEHCFEDYDSIKEYLTIDRLELDLGVFSSDQVISKMPEKLYQELQKILSSYHVGIDDFKDEENTQDMRSGNLSFPPTGERKTKPLVKNSEVAAFLFFLQHGYLPWWYSNEPLWDVEWLQKLTRENWKELENFLATHQENEVYYERALTRLISQFTDGFLAGVMIGLQVKEPVEKAWNWLARFYETLQKTQPDPLRNENSLSSLAILRQHFWKKWIRFAVDRSSIPGLATLFALIKQPSLISYSLSGLAENNDWVDSVPGFWQAELISLKQQEHKNKPALGINSEFVNHPEREKLIETEIAEHIAEEDFILIPDAGLVLLHPFLPRLFEYCNWLNKDGFVNDEARNRAVYALHYLAAGDEEAPEFVLMLPKLLCGVPLAAPIESALPLTDTEKAACDDLLVQVIGHWSALRNTSSVTLRETFLWRQGKLFSTDQGWRLEVQRKTEDVLLNRLPWGFSMIKLSWMRGLLSVSWE